MPLGKFPFLKNIPKNCKSLDRDCLFECSQWFINNRQQFSYNAPGFSASATLDECKSEIYDDSCYTNYLFPVAKFSQNDSISSFENASVTSKNFDKPAAGRRKQPEKAIRAPWTVRFVQDVSTEGIPDSPLEECNPSSLIPAEFIEHVKELFLERPIWTTLALQSRITKKLHVHLKR